MILGSNLPLDSSAAMPEYTEMTHEGDAKHTHAGEFGTSTVSDSMQPSTDYVRMHTSATQEVSCVPVCVTLHDSKNERYRLLPCSYQLENWLKTLPKF